MTSQLSNPFSTGGGGNAFETSVQTAFLTLMACNGFAPALPQNPISKVQYQGRYKGFHVDDLIVYAGNNKLHVQIKHSIHITKKNQEFKEVLTAAWHDFKEFNKGDQIALVTKYLSQTDIDNTLVILHWAKTSENAQDFYDKVSKTNFSSEKKQQKLKAFLTQIQNIDPTAEKEKIFDFLQCFYLLGLDLNVAGSFNKSLLETLLSQYYDGQAVFEFLESVSSEYNQTSGTITDDEIVNKLKDKKFDKKKMPEKMPEKFKDSKIQEDKSKKKPIETYFKQPIQNNTKELALANLIGSWNENNENDKLIIANIVDEKYNQWIKKIHPFLHQENSPIELHNGIWNVKDRESIWNKSAAHIYDNKLDRLKDNTLIVLKEKDPSFELKTPKRYLANIQNKVLQYSQSLRKGIAETIAIIGNNNDKLKYCDFDKRSDFASLITRKIFKNADWLLWGSINNLLPTLAQASPDVFLEQVKNTITQSPDLFIELFNQEGDGMFGGSYTTGLLWALEALAWDKNLFAQTCIILADLSAIDPGGRMANRPAGSLSSILLPWLPRTNASIEQRKKLVTTISETYHQVGWNLLLMLLHNSQQTSMSTYKPTWLKIDIKEEKSVLKKDYWNQCNFYADLIVSIAKNNINKLIILVKNIHHLDSQALNKLLEKIQSNTVVSLPEEKRLPLYFALIGLISEDTKYQDTKWALSFDIIKQIEQVANKIKPADLFNLHQRLFKNNDFDLYEELGDFDKQRKLLETKQENAVKKIFSQQGLEKIIEFALLIENSRLVGILLSKNTNSNIHKKILPTLLTTKDTKKRDFITGYCYGKYKEKGLDWLDSFDVKKWSVIEKANLLKNIEPSAEVWQKVSEWLGKKENLYWDDVTINPYWQKFNNFEVAMDKLLKYNRPNIVIDVINAMIYKKLPLDVKRSVKALLANRKLIKKNQYNPLNFYHIAEIIKLLQNSPDVSQDDLFKIEWLYLANMNRVGMDLKPTTLENKMATDPDFFCELMQYAYKSSNETTKKELNEQDKNIAKVAYNLLHHWETIPGFIGDIFSVKGFNNWLNSVKDKCNTSGRLDMALQIIGNTLIYTPKDKSGLWINKTIAQALNSEDSKEMREGFYFGIVNSRGVYTVDPTGVSEDNLADKYLKQADELEQNGYMNFAKTLKDISNSYKHYANRTRNKKNNYL